MTPRTSSAPVPAGFVLAAFALVLAACGAPRASSVPPSNGSDSTENLDFDVKPQRHPVTGHPLRIRYFAYRSANMLELVNESHSDPHSVYSKKVSQREAFTKIQTDEVMNALFERFRDHGFFGHVARGPAPVLSQSSTSQAFEVEDENGTQSWKLSDHATDADRKSFLACFKDFYELYNATIQMQAVDQAPEWNDVVNPPKPTTPPRRPKSMGGSGGGA